MKQGEEGKQIRSVSILLECVLSNKSKRDKSFYCRYRLKIYVNLPVSSKIIETLFYIDNEHSAYQYSFHKYLKI